METLVVEPRDVLDDRKLELRARLPDEVGDARTAIEIEIASKPSERLERIVVGYAASDAFETVRFLVASGSLARRLARVCQASGSIGAVPARLIVAPWLGAGEQEVARIEVALGSVGIGGRV